MKCPKCQPENREGIKFCEDCGAKFELQCPACQAKIPLGKKEVRGKKEPVIVYRVIAPSTRRTRFDVSAERGLTPFVGREKELDFYSTAMSAPNQAGGRSSPFWRKPALGNPGFYTNSERPWPTKMQLFWKANACLTTGMSPIIR